MTYTIDLDAFRSYLKFNEKTTSYIAARREQLADISISGVVQSMEADIATLRLLNKNLVEKLEALLEVLDGPAS